MSKAFTSENHISSATGFVPGAAAAKWLGRSGQFYDMWSEELDSFVLQGQDLYLLTSGNEVLWIGTSDDIVSDTSSRACFRTALKMASSVFRMPSPGDDITAMRTRWDIEGGRLAGTLALAS